jgi:hypothetical protein
LAIFSTIKRASPVGSVIIVQSSRLREFLV